MSAGSTWFGVTLNQLVENKVGTSGSLFEYYLVGGVWTKSASLALYDSQYYSDGTNRQTLGTNKWVAKYFYRDSSASVNNCYYLHGGQQNSVADALAEAIPAAPTVMTSHAIYVGKIVIQQ